MATVIYAILITGLGSIPIKEAERKTPCVIGGIIEPTEAPTKMIIPICSGFTFNSYKELITKKPITVAAAIASPRNEPAIINVIKIAAINPLGEFPNAARRLFNVVSIAPSLTCDSAYKEPKTDNIITHESRSIPSIKAKTVSKIPRPEITAEVIAATIRATLILPPIFGICFTKAIIKSNNNGRTISSIKPIPFVLVLFHRTKLSPKTFLPKNESINQVNYDIQTLLMYCSRKLVYLLFP